MFSIKEIYYTIQGEGFHSGRPAVFCRFSGCNLWSGREEDRHKAICQFCDTDFWGTDGENGGKYSTKELISKIRSLFPKDAPNPFVVCTGGEPALQLNQELVVGLQAVGFEVAIETNGTHEIPESVDWVCVSPKANTEIIIKEGDELKIVIPQKGIDPKDFENLNFSHFYVQAMESPLWKENTEYAVEYVMQHPKWKLSVQTHKYLGVK